MKRKLLFSFLLACSITVIMFTLCNDANSQQKGTVKMTQEKPEPFTVSFPVSDDSTFINVEGMKFLVKQNYYLFASLVKLQSEWQQYCASCYNDSSLIGAWAFIPTDTLGNGVFNGYNQYVQRWVHKEPTFVEFMDKMATWMNKQRVRK